MDRRFLALPLAGLLLAGTLTAACGDGPDPTPTPTATPTKAATTATAAAAGTPIVLENASSFPDGVKYVDTVVGTGATPAATSTVTLHYTLKLAATGQVLQSTVGKAPYTNSLAGFIPGFTEGVSTMKVGGKRTMLIPAALAYGANPPSGIPKNADLVFDVELVAVK